MRTRTWVGVGSAALCLVAAGLTLILIQSNTNDGPGAGVAAVSPNANGETTTPSPKPPTLGSQSPDPSAIPAPPDTLTPDREVTGPAAGPEVSNPLEVLPPQSGTDPTLPPSAKTPALVGGPAPSNADARGELAAGYPASSLPPESHSSITSSSVASDGEHVQLSLVAVSSTDPDGVLAFYTNTLATYGYFGATALAAGASEQSYSGPDGTVTVSAQRIPGGTSYSLFASVVAAN